MNAPSPRSMFVELVEVVMPYGVERPLRRPFTRTLIDTEDHTDAVLCGLDGETPVDEKDGLRAVLRLDTDGRYDLTINGPDGETVIQHYALLLLVQELRKAGVQ